MTEGTWLDFCQRRPGPPDKGGYFGIGRTRSLDLIEGEVKHSAEGGVAGMRSVLDNPSRQACWIFSIYKSGPPEQHYPLEWIGWTSGSPTANVKFVGMEHEGVAGQPLNENQIMWTTRISQAIRDLCPQVRANPPQRQVNLWEHREMTRFGADATTCPSGRIPWDEIIRRLGQDDMTAEEVRAVVDAALENYKGAIRQLCREAVDAERRRPEDEYGLATRKDVKDLLDTLAERLAA